jgi:ribosomal protein S18 acetylase RimI-like enzyme
MTALDHPSLTLQVPITLRLATQDDLPKLEWYGEYTHFRNLYARTYHDQQEGRRLMLLADCNRFPIGQIFILLDGNNRRIADGKRFAYLYALRVMEMFQGMGLGTTLIRTAEDLLYERGFRYTSIGAAKDNQVAQQLYLRLGYRIIFEDTGDWNYIDHEGKTRYVHEPCWILQKHLVP